MPKKTLSKILPSHKKIKEQKFLKIFGDSLHKKEIWSLNRKKVLGGVFVGVFVCFIPMPLQMIPATFLAIAFSVNLPISFALIFISNPLTMPFMYYAGYEFGNILLNRSVSTKFTIESISNNFDSIALALYTGSIVLGLIFSILSVFTVNLLWIKRVKNSRNKMK